jgi:hypothetical protein
MRFRNLRITWSVVLAVATLPVIARFQEVRGDPAVTNWNPNLFWPVIAALVALAIAPWLSSRFSLRTLLIATTLVAVALGLVVWAIKLN